jgi:hypothetical protein
MTVNYMCVKITLKIGGKDIEVSLEEAKQLHTDLNELFSTAAPEQTFVPVPYPTYPIYPTYPTYPIWSNTSDKLPRLPEAIC